MKKHKKRRRVHGLGSGKKSNLLTLGAIAVGYLAADTINDQIDKIVPKMKDKTGAEVPNTTIAMAGELGIGGLLLLKRIGPRGMQMPIKLAAGVLVGAGLKRALKVVGVIKGYQNVPVVSGQHRVTGYQNTPVISGVPPQLSGIPAQLSGGYHSQGSGVGGYNSQGSGVVAGIAASMNGSGKYCR